MPTRRIIDIADPLAALYALGLMEEEPRKDLNNEYSARCVAILAHEFGLGHLTADDVTKYVTLEGLVLDTEGSLALARFFQGNGRVNSTLIQAPRH